MKARMMSLASADRQGTVEKAQIRLPGYKAYLDSRDNRLFRLLAGVFSILAGQLFAGTILYLLPLDLSSVKKARELGIISRSAIDSYPKALEIRYYAFGVLISVISGLLIFFGITYLNYWRRRETATSQERLLPAEVEQPKPPMGIYRWGVLILILFLCTFYSDFIYKNWYWARWGFFFEEGIYYRWINDLLRGRILYKDIFFYGGPFLIWPQYWLMKLFGASIAINRYYVYFCYFIGYLIVFKVLRATIHNRLFMLIGLGLVVFYYHPMFPGIHRSLGRFAISLLSLYFLYRSFFEKRSIYLFLSGVLLAFALLFSQELGISAFIALGAMLAAFHYREREEVIKNLFHQISLICAGGLTIVVPVLVYFYFHHALGDFYEVVVKSPSLYVLGIWGYPFPNFLQLLSYPATGHYDAVEILLANFPIFFYICSVFFFLVFFFRRSFDNRHLLLFGVAVLGGIMLQRAFGIFYLTQIRTVIYPVAILSVGFLDMAWSRIRLLLRDKEAPGRKVEVTVYSVILALVFSGLFGYSQWPGYLPAAPPHIFHKYRDLVNRGYLPLNLARAQNVCAPPEEAAEIHMVVNYIQHETSPDESIFVFPFSPMYYFLADRLSPVKYPLAHCVTKENRQEAIRKLEEEKVNLIVYVQQPPSMDITPETRYPEIVKYIRDNYEVKKELPHTLILKRKESP